MSDCGDYEVRAVDAFRFAEDETLVFQLVIAERIASFLRMPRIVPE